MADLTINVPAKVVAHFLQADCGVRYWEDAEVNGVDDEDGKLIPFRVGDGWRPLIELDTGRIIDWPAGTTARVHYKVCDAGIYTLLDADRNELRKIEGYVPAMLSPGGSGFGDYVIMDIAQDGVIANWKVDLSYFEEN